MEWDKFDTHGSSQEHAFEVMCNILFEKWCRREYKDEVSYFTTVNGSGGDGGVEAYCILKDGSIIGVQSKWFRQKIESSQITQIQNSFTTAIKIRPDINKYIVCIPRDLGSDKNTRAGRTQNTEEGRWLNLVSDLKKDYPNIEVELWNETRICAEMQRRESEGCQAYWFGQEEFLEEKIKLSVGKARSSWGKTKYIPELYAQGTLHDIMEEYLGSKELSRKRTESIDYVLGRLKTLKQACQDMLRLPQDVDEELKKFLKHDVVTVDEWICKFEEVKDRVFVGETLNNEFDEKIFRLQCENYNLHGSCSYMKNLSFYYPLEKGLEGIYEDIYMCIEYIQEQHGNSLILLGNPGTGKTAGIISEVVNNLENSNHLPILVHARDFSDNDTWKSILEKTMGLADAKDEYDLFNILEITAQNYRDKYRDEGEADYISRCFICVDGIDEAPSYRFWKRMIDEAQAFQRIFPLIKFVFLSRPFVFDSRDREKYKKSIRFLPLMGDVPVKKIFKKYCMFYHINVEGNDTICDYLKTPLSLLLFCEIYHDQNVGNIEKNSMVITELFRRKIKLMEEDFSASNKCGRLSSIIHVSLIKLSAEIIKKGYLTYDEVCGLFEVDLQSKMDDILAFLESEGFLYSRIKEGDVLSPDVRYYSWGRQPALEYLIAEQMMSALEKKEDLQTFDFSVGMLQMFSILLLERKNKLIDQVKQVQLPKEIEFNLICYALVNVSSSISEQYKNYLKQGMRNSVDEFREIVNRVIFPCSKVKNHPLGGMLLDDFLREFKSAAERDIWWSIPGYLDWDFEEERYSCKNIDTKYVDYDLDCGFKDWPLIYVWRLSTTENRVRFNTRLELFKWGIGKPEEFYELFKYCNDIDDPQIIENLYAVAYGICMIPNLSLKFLKSISEWILENVFKESGLIQYRNSIVRYYARSIVEITISNGVEVENNGDIIMPPYNISKDSWPKVAKEAIDAERMVGYGPIDYDLSRYVLVDPIESKFFRYDNEEGKYKDEVSSIIQNYSCEVGLDSIKISGLIVALAYQYILEQGWNKEKFWNRQEDSLNGVDVTIRKTYMHATHGEQSNVMTVAEKYVWCARHMIEAFLADLVPICGEENGVKFLGSYCEIENMINVHQDYTYSVKHSICPEYWLHVDQLCNVVGVDLDNAKSSIKEWINKEHIPNFSKWIRENDGNSIMYSFTRLQEETFGIQEDIWINSGYVKAARFDEFLKELDTYSCDREKLLNVQDLCVSQKTRCYCSPEEACVVPQRREEDPVIYIGDIEVIAAIADCITTDSEQNEKIFYMPSQFSRELMGIKYGDGYEYYDEEGDTRCRYLEAGENWKTQQETVLIKSDIFESSIASTKYMPFWVFREFREATINAIKIYGSEIDIQFERTFLVWFEGQKCKYKELINLEPPESDTTSMEVILKEYL